MVGLAEEAQLAAPPTSSAEARAVPLIFISVFKTPSGWIPGTLRSATATDSVDKKTSGILPNGDRWVVLTFVLDRDVLKAHGKTSIGGVYPMYASMWTTVRPGSQAVRVISALPMYASSDSAVLGAVNDLKNLSSKGMRFQTASHGMVHVRARLSLFSADYVQAAMSSHTSGHASNAPCTVCAPRCASSATSGSGWARHCGFATTPNSVYRGFLSESALCGRGN